MSLLEMKGVSKWGYALGAIAGGYAVGHRAGRERIRQRWRRAASEGRPKVVAITGGARGLGLAFARRYLDRGALVAICSRNSRDLEAARQLLTQNYQREDLRDRLLTSTCDVGDYAQVHDWIMQVETKLGEIDLLINNAGVIQIGPYRAMNPTDFEENLKSNLWGVIHTCHCVVPAMISRRKGAILNVSSVGGGVPTPHLVPYATSKFGVVGFSSSLAVELRKYGIGVTTALPGLMRTGSFPNAWVKGDHEGETVWFSIAASLPFSTVSAENAVTRMVTAVDRGESFVTIGLQARLARLGFALFPSAVIRMLSGVDRVLPRMPLNYERRRSSKPARLYRTERSSGLWTYFGDRAASRYNEEQTGA